MSIHTRFATAALAVTTIATVLTGCDGPTNTSIGVVSEVSAKHKRVEIEDACGIGWTYSVISPDLKKSMLTSFKEGDKVVVTSHWINANHSKQEVVAARPLGNEKCYRPKPDNGSTFAATSGLLHGGGR